jgi:hypothetical protein
MLTALVLFAPISTPAVNLSDTGVGEALIFPYYTAQPGQNTLLSITNRTDKPKALKVRLREGMNGASVASFNLFLAAQDVWTGVVALTSASDGAASLLTGDGSCTTPAIRSAGLALSTRDFATDAVALQTASRTHEGYIEVFEMATIAVGSRTGQDVSFKGTARQQSSPSRIAACSLVSDEAVASNRFDFQAPSGGLAGSATIVSTMSSYTSTGYDAIALQSLDIRTGVTAAESSSPDWSDVKNTTAMLVDGSDANKPRMIAARFDRGVDAVSALFMASELGGEYSYSEEFAADWIVTMPTKRLYVNNRAPIGPFQNAWDGANGNGTATSVVYPRSFTREGESWSPSCGVPPPSPPPTANWSVGIFKFRQREDDTTSASALLSRNSSVWFDFTRCGSLPAIQDPRRFAEGGWGLLRLTLIVDGTSASSLVSRDDSIVVSSDGKQTVGRLSFIGLPAIGIAASAYLDSSGNGRFGFNSSYWLKATRLVR